MWHVVVLVPGTVVLCEYTMLKEGWRWTDKLINRSDVWNASGAAEQDSHRSGLLMGYLEIKRTSFFNSLSLSETPRGVFACVFVFDFKPPETWVCEQNLRSGLWCRGCRQTLLWKNHLVTVYEWAYMCELVIVRGYMMHWMSGAVNVLNKRLGED